MTDKEYIELSKNRDRALRKLESVRKSQDSSGERSQQRFGNQVGNYATEWKHARFGTLEGKYEN